MSIRLPSLASWSRHLYSRFLDACGQGLGSVLTNPKLGLGISNARQSKSLHKRFRPSFDALETRLMPAEVFTFNGLSPSTIEQGQDASFVWASVASPFLIPCLGIYP